MAATIEEEIGVKPEYIESSGGVFEVVADGQLIFSKKAEGRFPTEDEVLDKLRILTS